MNNYLNIIATESSFTIILGSVENHSFKTIFFIFKEDNQYILFLLIMLSQFQMYMIGMILRKL